MISCHSLVALPLPLHSLTNGLWLAGAMISVSRNDVARVMVESIARAAINLRFDLCAGVGGKPTLDANEVLLNARWPWQTSNKAEFEH